MHVKWLLLCACIFTYGVCCLWGQNWNICVYFPHVSTDPSICSNFFFIYSSYQLFNFFYMTSCCAHLLLFTSFFCCQTCLFNCDCSRIRYGGIRGKSRTDQDFSSSPFGTFWKQIPVGGLIIISAIRKAVSCRIKESEQLPVMLIDGHLLCLVHSINRTTECTHIVSFLLPQKQVISQ